MSFTGKYCSRIGRHSQLDLDFLDKKKRMSHSVSQAVVPEPVIQRQKSPAEIEEIFKFIRKSAAKRVKRAKKPSSAFLAQPRPPLKVLGNPPVGYYNVNYSVVDKYKTSAKLDHRKTARCTPVAYQKNNSVSSLFSKRAVISSRRKQRKIKSGHYQIDPMQ